MLFFCSNACVRLLLLRLDIYYLLFVKPFLPHFSLPDDQSAHGILAYSMLRKLQVRSCALECRTTSDTDRIDMERSQRDLVMMQLSAQIPAAFPPVPYTSIPCPQHRSFRPEHSYTRTRIIKSPVQDPMKPTCTSLHSPSNHSRRHSTRAHS